MRAPFLGYEELGRKGGDMGGEEPGVEPLPCVADSGERVK